MAVFTYIATAIVGAIGSIAGISLTVAGAATLTLTTAGVIATSIIAGGLGYITAKVTGVFKPPSIQQAKDPGVKVQLSPSTDHRVPVFYGRVQTGSIMVDAGITNRNNTMIYVMCISEKTDTGNYTINEIRRQDSVLNFSGATVTSMTDPNGTAANKVNGKMRCRVYAGNAQSSVNQIFPTTGKVAAQTLLSTITTATNYEDLVYDVFELDYDPEEGLTALGTITFDMTNTLSSPANVIGDYVLNDRYGAGLSSDEFDVSSLDAVYEYSNINGAYGNVEYATSANVTQYHDRWQIDGMLSTYQPVLNNIDELSQSCSSFFTYDNKSGKYKMVPNRALTTAEKANVFVFNDDNITSKVDITSTELYSLYNGVEAEYPSYEQKDQTKVALVTTPAGDRNANEPENVLNTRFNLVNDAPRVKNLSNIDLRQSRLSTTMSFEATHEALQVDVGDVVKVTQALYGYTDKLFRVMRVSEVEREDGVLRTKVLCLEYDDSVYTHTRELSDSALNLSGIPGWYTGIWGNVDYANIANIISGNIIIVDDPLANIANVIPDPLDGIVTGNIDIGNIDIGIGGVGIGSGGGLIPSINFPITIPDIPDISEIIANLDVTGSTVGSNVANTIPPTIIPIKPPGGNTVFTPGEIINVTIPQPEPVLQDQSFSVGPLLPDFLANIDLSMINPMGQSSILATAPNITLTPKGQIDRAKLGDVQAGLQIEEDGFNDNMANSALVSVPLQTDAALVTANTLIDVGAIDEGIFSAVNNMVPYGATLLDGNASIAYQPFRQINYKAVDVAPDGKMTANTSISNVNEKVFGSGIQASGLNNLGTFDDNFKYEVSRDRGSFVGNAAVGIPASNVLQYIPESVIVGNWANTNLSNASGDRRLDVTNSDKRISKSDFYLDIGGFF